MGLNFFQRRNILKKQNYLEMVPIRKSNFEVSDENLVTLVVPRFRNQKLNNFMLKPYRRNFKIKLDELGSAVWLLMDGMMRVDEICAQLRLKFGEDLVKPEERVTKFLTQLYEARYLSFKVLEDALARKA